MIGEILSEENRIKRIKDIMQNGKTEEGYGLRIKVKGEMKAYPAYKIPLNCLIYNQYNGRIASRVKTFEKEYRQLNAEKKEDMEIIEKYLWESEETKNQATMNDLIKNGQNVAGVVTIDGKIADGNRRASLLRKILKDYENNPKKYQNKDISKCEYFIAAIVDEKLTDKEMLELELNIQLAEEKVGYNSIEKYLKCDQLKNAGFSNQEICDMMKYDNEKAVERDLGVKKLMDEFLEYIGYPGIYVRLDETEDPFLGLYDTIQKVNNGKLSKDYKWEPNNITDINDLKIQAFNFIRADIGEEKQYRYITGAKKEAFFKNEKAWKNYLNTVKDSINLINDEEKTLDQYRIENPHSEVTELIKIRDEEWSKKVCGIIKKGIGTSRTIIEIEEEKNEPILLLSKARNIIEAINLQSNSLKTKEAGELIKDISSRIWEMKKINEKGIKND